MCRGLLNFGVGPQFYYFRGPHGYLKKKLSSNPVLQELEKDKTHLPQAYAGGLGEGLLLFRSQEGLFLLKVEISVEL